jgi:hypothetical protein
MQTLTRALPVLVVLGLAVVVASADNSKDKAKEKLKPNQVLLQVTGMH